MLDGFENITYDLTDEEKELVPMFVKSFSKRVGKENAITNKQIVSAFATKGIKVSEARVRLIISYIRDSWLVSGLIASSRGYYVTDNIDDMERWCNSMGQRCAKIDNLRKKGEEYLKQLYKEINK